MFLSVWKHKKGGRKERSDDRMKKNRVGKMMNKTAAVILALCMISAGTVFAAEETSAGQSETGERQFRYFEQISDYLDSQVRYDDVDKSTLYHGALEEILTQYPELYEDAMRGMLSSIDENSSYFTPEETEEFFSTAVTGEVVGIGVLVSMLDGNLVISEPVPDTPAANAGIMAGDILVSADGVDFTGMPMDEALSYVKGEAGTQVTVGIKRSGVDSILYFTMTREKIENNPVSYRVYEDEDAKAMYIRLYSFNEHAADRVKEALNEADRQGISNIIIDVRDNGGGVLEEAVKIAAQFVPEGKVITTEEHQNAGDTKIYSSSTKEQKYQLVMLINGNSASASEVLTAAVQENGVATVLGEQSYGKGTVQTLVTLNQGDSMKYTSAYYLTPNGNNIHKVGISPDRTVLNEYVPFDSSDIPQFTMQQVYTVGDRAEDVKTAKIILQQFGLYHGEINDLFDEALESAVAVFQNSVGLFSYGELDKTTQAVLRTEIDNAEVLVDRQLEEALAEFGIAMPEEE